MHDLCCTTCTYRTPLQYKYQIGRNFTTIIPQYLTKSAIFPAICGILPRNFCRDISEMSPQVSGGTDLNPNRTRALPPKLGDCALLDGDLYAKCH